MQQRQVFVSYSSSNEFEAGLLQYAIESHLRRLKVVAWTYRRDQSRTEAEVARALKEGIRSSFAVAFLLTPHTLDGGAAQWTELAYADAYDVKTFVLLHHLTFQGIKSATKGVPPLVLSRHCTPATDWRLVIGDLQQLASQIPKERS